MGRTGLARGQYVEITHLIFKVICSAAGKYINKIWMILGDFLFAFFVYCIF